MICLILIKMAFALICIKDECKIEDNVGLIELKIGDILIENNIWMKIQSIEKNCEKVDMIEIANATTHIPPEQRHCPNQGYCSAKAEHSKTLCIHYFDGYLSQFGSNVIRIYDYHDRKDRIKNECNCLRGQCYDNAVCVDSIKAIVKTDLGKSEIVQCIDYELKTNNSIEHLKGYYIPLVGAKWNGRIITNYDKVFQAWKRGNASEWLINEQPLFPNNIDIIEDSVIFNTEGKICKASEVKKCSKYVINEFKNENCERCEFNLKVDVSDLPCNYQGVRITCTETNLKTDYCKDVEYKGKLFCEKKEQDEEIEQISDWYPSLQPRQGLKTWQKVILIIGGILLLSLTLILGTIMIIIIIVIIIKLIPIISGIITAIAKLV